MFIFPKSQWFLYHHHYSLQNFVLESYWKENLFQCDSFFIIIHALFSLIYKYFLPLISLAIIRRNDDTWLDARLSSLPARTGIVLFAGCKKYGAQMFRRFTAISRDCIISFYHYISISLYLSEWVFFWHQWTRFSDGNGCGWWRSRDQQQSSRRCP